MGFACLVKEKEARRKETALDFQWVTTCPEGLRDGFGWSHPSWGSDLVQTYPNSETLSPSPTSAHGDDQRWENSLFSEVYEVLK